MMWWPPFRKRVLAEADEYLESLGEQAYGQCRTDSIDALEKGDHKRARFLGAVRSVLAKKLGRDRWLDTATRYLETPQATYDAGPGHVPHRPKDETLH